MMILKAKRAYDAAEKSDGFRVLADRLWPRGVSKQRAAIDFWAKEAAPSAKLRSWFHADAENRFKEFSKKYAGELSKSGGLAELKSAIKEKKTVTLITAVKDIEHSHIPVLLKRLK